MSFGRKVFSTLLVTKLIEKVKPLCISLPRMSGYTKSFKETKYMFFYVKTNCERNIIKPGIKSTIVKSPKILNDSVFNIGKIYYPLEFLEECKWLSRKREKQQKAYTLCQKVTKL